MTSGTACRGQAGGAAAAGISTAVLASKEHGEGIHIEPDGQRQHGCVHENGCTVLLLGASCCSAAPAWPQRGGWQRLGCAESVAWATIAPQQLPTRTCILHSRDQNALSGKGSQCAAIMLHVPIAPPEHPEPAS